MAEITPITLMGKEATTPSKVRNGQDNIKGGDGADQIYGDHGSDYIEGGEGKDSVWGGNGNDIAYGGSNGDQLSGGLAMTLYMERQVQIILLEGMEMIL